MSLFISSLNSGSNGNCYYIGNSEEGIFVDLGISCREAEERMERLGLSLQKVKAIFISHEHHDHISGVSTLAKKYKLPVYTTPATLRHCHFNERHHQIKYFTPDATISIGRLKITAFAKIHDACEPYSFVVADSRVTVGVFTDIGYPDSQLTSYFAQCHAAFLESNYDEVLLENGRYPYFLKKRIRGGKGHLSNAQALEVFTAHKHPQMSHLILSHLSQENNCPELVFNTFSKHAAGVKVVVASRFKETELYAVTDTVVDPYQRQKIFSSYPIQASLF
ncbi:MAG: MBL fold metallo-hydrolase [Flavisolibacter sp.]